jgi:transcriptional regulator with XRE-family HTH domain
MAKKKKMAERGSVTSLVLKLQARGLRNKEIAEKAGVSPSYISVVLRKAGLSRLYQGKRGPGRPTKAARGVSGETPYKLAGRKLKAMRQRAGWTQKEVSTKVGITEGFLSFLESGTKQGSLDTYIDLSRLYQYPLEDLFRGGKEIRESKRPSIYLDGLSKAEIKAVKQVVRALRAKG